MDFLKDLYEKIKQAVGFIPKMMAPKQPSPPPPSPSSMSLIPMSILTMKTSFIPMSTPKIQTPTLSVPTPKPSSFNLKNFLGNILSTGGNIIKKEVIEPLWEGPGMPELRKAVVDFPLFKEPIKSAKQTLEGVKKELYNPSPNIIGFTKNVGVPLAKTTLDVYGLSKIPQMGYKGLGLLATLGAVLSPKGQRLEGAKKMLETSPKISAIGSFTNPVISSVSQSVGSKFATELGRQVATRGTSALLNIPETMIYRKALTGKADYHLSDLPSDILFGSLTNAPVSSVSKLDDIAKNIKEAKKEIKSIKTIPNSIEQMVSDLAREFKKKAGEEISINLSDIKNVSQDVIDKLKRGESIVGRNYSIVPEEAFGKPTGKITIILEENFKPIKIKTPLVSLKKIETVKQSSQITPPSIEPPKPKVEKPVGLLPEPATLTPKEAVRQFKKGRGVYPFKKVLPSSEEKFFVSETGEIRNESQRPFIELIREKIYKSGNKELINRFEKTIKKSEKIQEQMIKFNEYRKPSQWHNKIPILNKTLASIKERIQPMVKHTFSDVETDEVAKNTIVGVLNAVRQNVEETKNKALIDVKNILGRHLTKEELGLVLRGEVEKFAELAKKGATKIKIGEDLLKDETLKQVYKAVEPVADDVMATVLTSYKMLDDWVADGYITREHADKLALAGVNEFVKNFGKYLRTYYDNDAIYQRVGTLYQPAVAEFALRNPSAKRKLNLYEWGRGYLNYLDEGGIPLTKEAIPEDLLEGVIKKEEGAIQALGERVKEAAGYIIDGEESLRRTMNYLARHLYNINILNFLRGRDDLISKIPKEGFVKIADENLGALNGLFIRKDIYDEIKDIHTFMKQGNLLEDMGRFYTSLWKMGATSLRPSSYVRNWFYGFYVQNTLGGNSPLNPLNLPNFIKGATDYAVYLKTGIPQAKELDEFLRLGGAGGHYTKETIEVIRVLSEGLKDAKDANAFKKLIGEVAKLSTKVADISEIYSAIDGVNKYTFYLSRLKKGYDPVSAVMEAQYYLNNYALNPKFIRELSRSAVGGMLVPFISFTAANVPLILKEIIAHPHRVALAFALPQIIKQWFYLSNSKEVALASSLVTPEWQFSNPYFIPVGVDEENKKIYFVDFYNLINIPIRSDPKEMAAEVVKWAGGSAIMPSGITSGIWQGIQGVDIWGRKIPEDERALAFVKSVPGGILASDLYEVYKAVVGAPSLTSGKTKTIPEAVLKNLMGIPIYRYGAEQFKSNVNGAIIEFQEAIQPYKKALLNPEVSDVKKIKAIQKIEEKKQGFFEKLKKIFGRGGGIKPQEDLTEPSISPLLKEASERKANKQETINPLSQITPTTTIKGGVSLKKVKVPKMKEFKYNLKMPKEEKEKPKKITLSKISPPPKTSSYRKYLVNIKKINRK